MKRVRLGILSLALVALAPGAFGPPAAAAEPASAAEAFVQAKVSAGLALLTDTSLSKEQKRAQFRAFLLGLTDLNHIADYTLGPAKNTASPADLAEFEDAFREYAIAIYEAQFEKYSGQTLRVTGSTQLGASASIVMTQLIDPRAHAGQRPIEVDFRVFGESGNFTVGDVVVLGVDLAITEQDQFQAFLWQHKNDVKALAELLKQRAANVRASG